jgi:hypothetical protein
MCRNVASKKRLYLHDAIIHHHSPSHPIDELLPVAARWRPSFHEPRCEVLCRVRIGAGMPRAAEAACQKLQVRPLENDWSVLTLPLAVPADGTAVSQW